MFVSAEVAAALEDGRPVVALETTIFSHLGLPSPHNRTALDRCVAAIRAADAVPALTAVLDGRAVVGVDESDFGRVCGPARKLAARDLGVAIAAGCDYGATTVSAALTLARSAGIRVFATGGIGGVHHDVAETLDVSADLGALAAHPVLTVSAGAKVFLDLPRTLEALESAGIPVIGYRCDEFPAFYARSSGLPVPQRFDEVDEIGAAARWHWTFGGGGLLVANPIPEDAALPWNVLRTAITDGLARAAAQGATGPAATPAVLAEIASSTAGNSVTANVVLAESNARLGAQIAAVICRR